MEAVDSTLRRLDSRGVGYLHGKRLPNSRTLYYRLTRSGSKHLGIRPSTQPMRVSRLFSIIARLYFINRAPKDVQRTLTTNEMMAKFMDAKALEKGEIRPPRVDFYIAQTKIETAEKPEVAMGAILPDLNSSVERVVKRCIKHSMNFVERGWFVDVMRAGRFEWTILTGHKAKREELLRATTRVLQRRMASLYFHHSLDSTDVPPIRVKVEAIPELANLRLLKKKKKPSRDSSQPVDRPREDN